MINSFLKALWQEEDGQDLVEYSLLLAFIAMGAIAVLGTIRTSINGVFTSLGTQLKGTSASVDKIKQP